MEFIDFIKYLLTFITGLGAGSLLTLFIKSNSKNQSKNTISKSIVANGNFINGNNNHVNENNDKGKNK